MKKEKNRSIIYVAVFIALLMALSAIGFIWSGGGDAERYRYNDYSFSYENNKWVTQTEGKMLAFNYLPATLLNISLPSQAVSLIQNARMVYITYNETGDSQELALAQYNLGRNLGTNARFVINALVSENNNNLPVITCKNATPPVPVIVLEETSANDSIILNNSCITLKGSPGILGERLIYSVYGIIQDG